MHLESSDHFLVGYVVEEDALAHRADWHGSAELAVASLEDGGGGLLQEWAVKLGVVHGETGTREECEETAVVGGLEEPPDVGQCGRVRHVDGDGVAVAQGRVRDELMERRPPARVSIGL